MDCGWQFSHRSGFGQSVWDFWFRIFPLPSRKRRKGEREENRKGERILFTPVLGKPWVLIWKFLHKNFNCMFLQYMEHHTTSPWSPGATPGNSESRNPDTIHPLAYMWPWNWLPGDTGQVMAQQVPTLWALGSLGGRCLPHPAVFRALTEGHQCHQKVEMWGAHEYWAAHAAWY